MDKALVARVRYHIQKANFMGLKEAESTLLLKEAADAIEDLQAQLMYSNPAADVRPVVHGRWITPPKNRDYAHMIDYYECPLCGFIEDYLVNFCPNCGADMRGDSNE